jgi:hypothetical protein
MKRPRRWRRRGVCRSWTDHRARSCLVDRPSVPRSCRRTRSGPGVGARSRAGSPASRSPQAASETRGRDRGPVAEPFGDRSGAVSAREPLAVDDSPVSPGDKPPPMSRRPLGTRSTAARRRPAACPSAAARGGRSPRALRPWVDTVREAAAGQRRIGLGRRTADEVGRAEEAGRAGRIGGVASPPRLVKTGARVPPGAERPSPLGRGTRGAAARVENVEFGVLRP